MISPHTPPGTLVVFRPVTDLWNPAREAGFIISPGHVYRVDRVVKNTFGGFGLLLVETADFHRWRKYEFATGKYRYTFPLEDFDLAVLPKCLADIRDSAPVEMQETVGAK